MGKTNANSVPGAGKPARRGGKRGFVPFDLHVTCESDRRTVQRLLEEGREAAPVFALEASEGAVVTSETVARRILDLALASERVPKFVRPKVDGSESDFVSLGVETVPLTKTKVVKFRQHVRHIPVYGSLVAIELDEKHEFVSLNSNLASPSGCGHLARVSPLDATKPVAERAGYAGRMLPVTPLLNYYLDRDGAWHLAYVLEHVRIRPCAPETENYEDGEAPLAFDYVVDAMSGEIVADLPRTVALTEERQGRDVLGNMRPFRISRQDGIEVLRDASLNVETFDAGFQDPRSEGVTPPDVLRGPRWSRDAVSAHANAAVVARYLREVLKRNGIDNKGGRIVSLINCVVEGDAQRGKKWENAVWDGQRMLYGQTRDLKGKLRSFASNLDVVAHEFFHGVSGATARLEYEGETGALNESYSDIFGILISNWERRGKRAEWDWELGENLLKNCKAMRNFRDPALCHQPKHYGDYRRDICEHHDKGGVHTNSGIHNYAAYTIMTALDRDGDYLFEPRDLAAMFYVALSQHLSRQATFSDSRRAVLLATRSYFRHLPAKYLNQRVQAVEDGFAAAGIS